MGSIHPLPERVINKIAAGEVIEKPMYILKELLDNALDASSRSIIIKFTGYGLGSIQVIDDGIGMTREDVQVSYLRHTTSKIFDETDLEHIQSFGFRGEALSSIASVCRVSIASRSADAIAGYRVILEEGVVIDERLVPMPQGTDVTVSHIFESVPARRKYLRSEQTEYRQMISLVQIYALSFPQIRFQVFHNNKQVMTYPAPQSVELRLKSIIPSDIVSSLLPLTHESEYIKGSGYISHPKLSYKTTKQYYIYLNGRSIFNSTISRAIKQAYGTLLSPLEYPYIILFLEVPPHLVDVNVHPRKEEVKFVNTKAVFQAVYNSIIKTLDAADMRYVDHRWQSRGVDSSQRIRDGGTQTYAANKLRDIVLGKPEEIKGDDLLQIHNLYILAETAQGMILIDQHAAHERVLYERFMKAYKEGVAKKESASLEKPLVVQLTSPERIILEEYKDEIQSYGFSFVLTENGMEISHVPELVKDREIAPLMRELLEMITEDGADIGLDSYAHRMITFLACRSAIKAGDPLTKKRMKELLDELKEAENQSTCPHGRPIKVEVELHTVNTMFKR
ncbi:DNA mismatch repair endonuclease MutL [Candidatus Woesebacteria bacterium]|nr:DNA mismatch repair endonuclease MutL [Candidatus Woesebacteria bacterium]